MSVTAARVHTMTAIPLGAPAAEVVVHIIRAHPEITSLKLIQYPPTPTFKQVTTQSRLTIDEELERRLRHGGKIIKEHSLPGGDLANLSRLIATLPAHEALAVSSEVTLQARKEMHIPMIDFQCTKSPSNLEYLRSALRRIGPREGTILESVKSYHYYGIPLLSKSQWYEFIGRCLLLEPLVDVRYLGHVGWFFSSPDLALRRSCKHVCHRGCNDLTEINPASNLWGEPYGEPSNSHFRESRRTCWP
jgi:hypothetical protein